MFENVLKIATWGVGLFLFSSHSFALTPTQDSAQNNAYVFIENNIDKEYFIAPDDIDPRFSGANVWTKHGKTRQVSLGYMGRYLWLRDKRNVDMWIDNSFANGPFNGVRCNKGRECPEQGFISPTFIDSQGFYKAATGSGLDGGGYGFASFSANAYEAFKSAPVGSSYTSILNWCVTQENYDPTMGERCKNANTGQWRKMDFTHNKIGHISLNDTRGASEIWVATDGTPFLIDNSQFCEHSVVTGLDGVICKMLNYNYKKSADPKVSLKFNVIVDKTILAFTPLSSQLKISGDKVHWHGYGVKTSIKEFFTPGSNYIYMFFSKSFFKELVKKGGTINSRDSIFTFNFDNENLPESGFYQFSTSTSIDVIPREYGISVRPEEESKGLQSGVIGSNRSIDFNYLVTLSSPKMAQTVTAQVRGSSLNKNGQNFCAFQPSDKSYDVLIPSYLSYTKTNGILEKIRNGCGDVPINITNAAWDQLPWDSQQSGYFFSTPLKLSFPMHENVSRLTESGQNWEGTVYAEGDVKVRAEWIGVP